MTAIPSQGTVLAVSIDGGSLYTDLCTIASIGGPTGNKNEIDVTTLCSVAKDYLSGLPDYGNVALSGIYDPADAGLDLMLDLFNNGNIADFRITLTDSANTTLSFKASVSEFSWAIEADDATRLNMTLRTTGPVTKS